MLNDPVKERKPSALPVKYESIPDSLKAVRRWVCWNWQPNESSKMAKVPINARTGGKAISTKAATWSTFAQACDAYEAEGYSGIGFVLGEGWCGWDIDKCRDPATGDFNDDARALLDSIPDTYAEISPSATGVKLLFKTDPENLPDSGKGTAPGGTKYEFYSWGRYFAITGKRMRSRASEVLDVDVSEAHKRWIGGRDVVATGGRGIDAAVLRGAATGWDLERVREQLLPHLKGDDYDDWMQVGMALHHQAQLDDDDQPWLDLWDEWSQDFNGYNEDGCEAKWTTFSQERDTGNGVLTLATLIKKVQKEVADSDEAYEALAEYTAGFQEATELRAIQRDLPEKIRADIRLSEMLREMLTHEMQAALLRVTGKKMKMDLVREALKPETSWHDDNTPDWMKQHVWIIARNSFFDTEAKVELSVKSFDTEYNRYMEKDFKTRRTIISASQAATDLWPIKTVQQIGYMPGADAVFVDDRTGVSYANMYDAAQIPNTPRKLSQSGKDAIALIERHLELMLPDERERELFLSWMAFVCARPGVKVRWAPYLSGPPGDGKSFFKQMLKVAMGGSNVREMSGALLNGSSTFSDWAVGAAVRFIEELKLHGVDKFDAVNKIKPYITNDDISVHPKGFASYDTFNTQQYCILSNFADGVPIDDDDRRFMFLKSGFTKTTLLAFLEAEPDYHKNLYAAIRDNAGAVRYWLLQIEREGLHPDFDPDGRAPKTAARSLVVHMSQSDVDVAIADVWEEGAPGINGSYVASGLFVSAVRERIGEGSKVSDHSIGKVVSNFLTSEGMHYTGKRIRLNGAQQWIWAKKSETVETVHWAEEARESLEKTLRRDKDTKSRILG